MAPRKKTPSYIEVAILTKSARRCPICYHLHGDLEVKNGQIAHLDQDSKNSKEENLVFLCMAHHSDYDSVTSQHKNFTKEEVYELRNRLYNAISNGYHHQVKIPESPKFKNDAPYNLEQLLEESNNRDISVSTLLRKAKIIAKKRSDETALDWIDKELKGYENILAEDLPSYRQVYGEAFANNGYRGWEPIMFGSAEQKKSYTYVPNGQPIGTIEETINNLNSKGVLISSSQEITQSLAKALDQSASVQIRVSPTTLRHILEVVRNKIHDWASNNID